MRTASTDFSFEEFWEDVFKYMKHNNISPTNLADRISMDPSNICDAVKYRKTVHLSTMLRLAYLCDLDVNSYSLAHKSVVI